MGVANAATAFRMRRPPTVRVIPSCN